MPTDEERSCEQIGLIWARTAELQKRKILELERLKEEDLTMEIKDQLVATYIHVKGWPNSK